MAIFGDAIFLTLSNSYLMYEYPIISLGVFFVFFSSIEITVAGSIWLVTSAYMSWGMSD